MKVVTLKLNKNKIDEQIIKAKEILAENDDVELTLYLGNGRYNLTETAIFDKANSEKIKKVRLVGASKNKTFVTSSVKFHAEDFVRDGELSYYQFKKDEKGEYPKIGAFYINGKITPVASSKMHVISPYFMDKDGNILSSSHAKWHDRNKFYLKEEIVKELDLETHTGVELRLWVEWEFKFCHLERVDLSDYHIDENGVKHVAIHVNKNETIVNNSNLYLTGRRMQILNCKSVLIKDGGYVYDAKEGKLFLRTTDLDYAKTYSVGLKSRLFRFIGLDNVEISGITFAETNDYIIETYPYWASGQAGSSFLCLKEGEEGRRFSDYGAVGGENLNGFNLYDCIFRDLPCGALIIDEHSKNINVNNNDFLTLGASAIRFGKPIPDLTIPAYLENVNIYNNYIKNVANKYPENCAITVTRAKNLRISYNTILSCAYTGISVGWHWTREKYDYEQLVNVINADISHNYIKSFMTNMLDGGAIYMLGSNCNINYTGYVNFVHDNYIVEDKFTCPENKFFSCLYHDGSSSNWYDADNVVVHERSIDSYSSRMFVQYYYPQLEMFNIGTEYAQNAWNIGIKNNHYINCHRLEEVYQVNLAHVMIDETRNIFEENLKMYKDMKEAMNNPSVRKIINCAGCKR